MPHSTTWSSPCSRSSTAERRRSRRPAAREVSDSATQPSRLPASSSASGPHSVGSCAAIRLATLSSTSFSTAAANAVSSGYPKDSSNAAAVPCR